MIAYSGAGASGGRRIIFVSDYSVDTGVDTTTGDDTACPLFYPDEIPYARIYCTDEDYLLLKLVQEFKIWNTQWVLRDKPYKPKIKPLAFKAAFAGRQKILRCNRKGIGLRIRMHTRGKKR